MKVGIDLGTTNSAISYIDENGLAQIIPNREGSRVTPSVVLFDESSVIVGEFAKNESIVNPENTVQFVKRYIGRNKSNNYFFDGDEMTPEEISALILKKLKEDAQDYLGEKITDAVITVPAEFNDNERQATIDACKIAGINLIKLINEPTAAALAYGINRFSQNQNIVVYDLGGGTFDSTVMEIKDGEINIKSSLGDKNIGGFDFDNKIIDIAIKEFESKFNQKLYTDKYAMQELREKAEQCKKTLSSRSKSTLSIASNGNSIRIDITQEQFNYIISGLVDKTIRIMNYTVKQAGLTWNDIDKILLVGGSTRIPKISMDIEKFTGIKPSKDINPDEAVAMGAAIQANIDSFPKKMKVTDVSAHSLGILARKRKNNELVNQNYIVIDKNTSLPCEKEVVFRTAVDNQKEYVLRLTEGESSDAECVDTIGTAKITLKERPKGSPLKVKLYYDENSIVNIEVIDDVDSTLLKTIQLDRNGNLNQVQINEKQDKISFIDIDK